MMRKLQALQKLIISVLIIVLSRQLGDFVFAATYVKPEVIVGPASAEPETVKLDETNYAFESMSKMMSKEDNFKVIYCISEYRKGNKDIEQSLIEVLEKYNSQNASFIAEYMLRGNTTKLVASYSIDHTHNNAKYIKVLGLTGDETDEIRENGNKIWKKLYEAYPKEFANAIDRVYLELYKVDDSSITICEIGNDAKRYSIYIDVRLFAEDSKEEFWRQIIYSTIYYYILRKEQVADELIAYGDKTISNYIKKENYSYGQHYYRDDSYIDTFYKRWWKGRRKEINLGQADLYPNDFLNSKASKSVYEDMAVSFYYYFKGLKNNNTEQIKYKKIEFFDNYDLFKVLKKYFKKKTEE